MEHGADGLKSTLDMMLKAADPEEMMQLLLDACETIMGELDFCKALQLVCDAGVASVVAAMRRAGIDAKYTTLAIEMGRVMLSVTKQKRNMVLKAAQELPGKVGQPEELLRAVKALAESVLGLM